MDRSRQLLDAVEQFTRQLRDGGVHASLGFLNARTRHRFTGVYRFEPPMLRSVALFDRENPSVLAYHAAPLIDDGGTCIGSLCHWDVRPRIVPDMEVPLLFAVAPLLARAVALEPVNGVQH